MRDAVPLSEYADGVLIELYRAERDAASMRALVERHHDSQHRRFMQELQDAAAAEACSRDLWIRAAGGLDDFGDDDDFTTYLAEIATELIENCVAHRGARHRVRSGADDGAAERELMERLVRVLIPSLPIAERMAWLLWHEGHAGSQDRRLEWSHLAELNGLTRQETWKLFESARTRFMNAAGNSRRSVPDEQETLVFLVWTQAHKPAGVAPFSWDYLADLLGVSTGSMRRNYQAASRALSRAIENELAGA